MKISYHFLLVLLFSVLGYSTESNSCNYWVQGANMPTARSHPYAGVLGDNIYTFGHLNNNRSSDKVEVYNTKTDTWSIGPDMPFARGAGDTSVIDKKIYMIGGYTNNSDFDSRLLILDTETNAYSYGANIAPNIVRSRSIVIDKKIYLFGGYNSSIGSSSDKSFIYNPATNVWTNGPDMPFKLFSGSINYYNDKIYFMGGTNANNAWRGVQDVHIYDVKNNIWSKGADMPTGLVIDGQNSIIGDKIYIPGGYTRGDSSASAINLLQIYDISDNSWSMGENMPVATSGRFLAVGNKIYVTGGESSNSNIGRMDIYIPCIEENKEIKTAEIRSNSDLRSLARDNNILVNLIDSNDIINIYLKNGAWTGDIKFPTINIKEGRVINVHRASSWGSNMHLSSSEAIYIPKGDFSFKYKNGKWIPNLIVDNTKLGSLSSINNTLLPEILDVHDKVYVYLKNGAWTKDIKINIPNACSANRISKSIIINRVSDLGSTIHIGSTTASILKGTTTYAFEL